MTNSSNGSNGSNRMMDTCVGDQGLHNFQYSPQQVSCIIHSLQQSSGQDKSGLDKLDKFISSLPPNEHILCSEDVLLAKANLAFNRNDFKELYRILESHQFSVKNHKELQNYWYEAHYRELARTRGRQLGAVDKYRIRKKFPLPQTIWDGEEYVYCFKEKSRNALKESYKTNMYPSPEEKKKLSQQTGLTWIQGLMFLLISCLTHNTNSFD